MGFNTHAERFGFIEDIRKCVGKTIEIVEMLAMPYGCTYSHAIAILFTDGTRALFAGTTGTGIYDPVLEAVAESRIFTAEEYGKMQTSLKRHRDEAERRRREEKQRLLERLKKELNE